MVVDTTQHHLFYDLSTKTWVEAENLHTGDRLYTPDSQLATVVGSAVVPGAADMWDLTVNGDHDFYVLTSATAVLVHNCPAPNGGANVPADSDLGQAIARGARTTTNFQMVAENVSRATTISVNALADNVHVIAGLTEDNPDVIVGFNGDVYNAPSGDLLGNIGTG